MCRYIFAIVGAALLAASAGPVQAGDAARALLDRALQAAGGEAVLAKYPASTAKIRGSVRRAGRDVAMGGETTTQGADQVRFATEMAGEGFQIKFVHILNRTKGWNKIDDEVLELTAEQLARARNEAYVGWVTSLAPLRDKTFTLTALPERTSGDRPVLGLRVARKGWPDVTLYFDKETATLVRSDTRVLDEDTKKEMTETTQYSDYKVVQGVKTPMKTRTLRDGKPFMDLEILEIKYFEKVSDQLFDKP